MQTLLGDMGPVARDMVAANPNIRRLDNNIHVLGRTSIGFLGLPYGGSGCS